MAGTVCSSWTEVEVLPLVALIFFYPPLASLMAHPSFHPIVPTAHSFSWPHDRG